jgi:hypothetical protein
LNLKCIKFNQTLLEKMILEKENTHCFSFCKQHSQPKTLARGPAGEPGSSRARAYARGLLRPGPVPSRTPPRTAPRARAARGRANLGPGRHFARPHGPKAAQPSAARSRPHDEDRRLRAVLGRSKTPFAARSPNPSLILFFPRRLLLLHASARVSGRR